MFLNYFLKTTLGYSQYCTFHHANILPGYFSFGEGAEDQTQGLADDRQTL